VESAFAHVDWTTRTLCGASVAACLGVAHAAVLKAFASEGEKKQVSAAAARKKTKQSGELSNKGDEAAAEEMEKWDTTSFFKIPG
jgi:hypothetical protein